MRKMGFLPFATTKSRRRTSVAAAALEGRRTAGLILNNRQLDPAAANRCFSDKPARCSSAAAAAGSTTVPLGCSTESSWRDSMLATEKGAIAVGTVRAGDGGATTIPRVVWHEVIAIVISKEFTENAVFFHVLQEVCDRQLHALHSWVPYVSTTQIFLIQMLMHCEGMRFFDAVLCVLIMVERSEKVLIASKA